MDKTSLAIATIAWAQTKEEETLLLESLATLSRIGIPIFITDGGSSELFVEKLRQLPNIALFTARGLWTQARQSISEACQSGAKTIFYTEPDKLQFFQRHLESFITNGQWDEKTGVLMASRSAKAFATFPPFQQLTESTINQCCQEITGVEGDYCYGPFLFDHRLVQSLDVLPETIGWGWRSFLFAAAHRLGFPVAASAGDFLCPGDQRTDDAVERIYRMKQLAQNIDGLVLATATYPVK
ncbi:MAG: hypothetical protein M3Q06_06240 [Bacteroidota bacterium]|nr:hypothetical protein [Bacteroidota bacterium]